MMLTKRDEAIIKDLNKFRVMDRDSVAELHFSNLKNKKDSTNHVLLRLLRDGHIQRSTAFTPYLYFSNESQIKKNSQKIGHFLAILNTYKEVSRHGVLESFLVEPKYGKKGTVEPDVYMYFRNTPFFLEIQKSIYSDKQMKEKLDRYLNLFQSGIIAKPFPHILILSEQRYGIDRDYPFKIFQAETFTSFLNTLKMIKEPVQIKSSGIKVRIG